MKFMRLSITLSSFSLVGLLLLAGLAMADDVFDERPGPASSMKLIDGLLSPEDIEVLPDGDALIVGSFNLRDGAGDLRVVYLDDHRVEVIYSPTADANTTDDGAAWGESTCPGAPSGFSVHGIHLSKDSNGVIHLLAVNHTGRESIEWFEIKKIEQRYVAQWRGCVMVDDELWINDVAMLPHGGIVASQMMPRKDASTMLERKPQDGIESGYVVEWQADSGWRKVPGSDGALPNGIQVSADGTIIYSNHYLSNRVVAIERATGQRIWSANVSGAPDNMSVTSTGELLVAMHHESLQAIAPCLQSPTSNCGLHFGIAAIDAASGAVRPVFDGSGARFGGSTVAVKAGEFIYLGAFAGTHIARIAAP